MLRTHIRKALAYVIQDHKRKKKIIFAPLRARLCGDRTHLPGLHISSGALLEVSDETLSAVKNLQTWQFAAAAAVERGCETIKRKRNAHSPIHQNKDVI